jgi:[ribosomal protein S5]-alanine N-acetyltransferase
MAPAKGRPVLLKTDRFELRSVTPADASDRWLGWVKDPAIMGPLNLPVRAMRREELAAYIASIDNNMRFLVGIFDKAGGMQIGFFMIDIEIMHRYAIFNVAIGDKDWWGKGVVNEARAALLDHFFEARGIEKAVGLPLARNFPALFNYKAQGWRHEGTLHGQCLSLTDGSRLDQYQFGLLRKEWRKPRANVVVA